MQVQENNGTGSSLAGGTFAPRIFGGFSEVKYTEEKKSFITIISEKDLSPGVSKF